MIGVVIAVRDQAQYLGEALDSVAAQTLQPEQIIVVDDGSTDGSGDVARARGIRTILAGGEGPAVARNLGAAELTTEFVTFLDGDDRFTPLHHEKLLAVAGDAAAGHVTQFYDPGREAELAAKHPLIEEPALGGTLGALLIRRSAFEKLGGFSTDAHEFFALIQGLGEFPSVDDVVLERRIHGANRSIVNRDEIRAAYLKSARAAILAKRATG